MGLFNLFNKRTNPILEKLIEDKNKQLWDEMSFMHKIELVSWNREEYAAEIQNKDARIYISNTYINSALFTHELLHLKLRSENIFFAIFIYKVCENQYILMDILNLQNALLIGNLLDHIFMYKEFTDMGYREENFVLDYNADKFTKKEHLMLSKEFSELRIKRDVIGYYITKYIALRTLKESKSNYSYAYDALYRIDNQLYHLLESMMNRLISLSEKNYRTVSEHYLQIIGDFLKDLEVWINGKIII